MAMMMMILEFYLMLLMLDVLVVVIDDDDDGDGDGSSGNTSSTQKRHLRAIGETEGPVHLWDKKRRRGRGTKGAVRWLEYVINTCLVVLVVAVVVVR